MAKTKANNTPALDKNDIGSLKAADEEFMHTVEGNLRLDYIHEMMYSFLPYPFYYGLSPLLCTTYVKCIMAVTNKKVIIAGVKEDDTINEKHIYYFPYDKIKVEFKKKLGKRSFVVDIRPQRIFNFIVGSIVFEVEDTFIKQAEYLNEIILRYLKQP